MKRKAYLKNRGYCLATLLEGADYDNAKDCLQSLDGDCSYTRVYLKPRCWGCMYRGRSWFNKYGMRFKPYYLKRHIPILDEEPSKQADLGDKRYIMME